MAETMLYVNEHGHDHLFDHEVPPEWIRSFQPGDYPVFTVADGTTVVVSGHPAERGTFDRFVSAMQRPDLAQDPRFADVPSRLANLAALTAEIETWAATVPDAETCEQILATHELAMGVLRTYRELAESDWARERGAIVEVEDRIGGTVRIPNAPWRFSDATTACAAFPATAVRTTGRCSSASSASPTPRSTRSRPTASWSPASPADRPIPRSVEVSWRSTLRNFHRTEVSGSGRVVSGGGVRGGGSPGTR